MWVWVELYYLLIPQNEWKDLTSCFSAAQTVILLSTSGQILQIFWDSSILLMTRKMRDRCTVQHGLNAEGFRPKEADRWKRAIEQKESGGNVWHWLVLTLWNSQSGIVSMFETPAAIAGTRLKGSGFDFNNLWWSHAPVTISHLPLLPIYPDLSPLSTLRLQTTAFYSYHTWCFFVFF